VVLVLVLLLLPPPLIINAAAAAMLSLPVVDRCAVDPNSNPHHLPPTAPSHPLSRHGCDGKRYAMTDVKYERQLAREGAQHVHLDGLPMWWQ